MPQCCSVRSVVLNNAAMQVAKRAGCAATCQPGCVGPRKRVYVAPEAGAHMPRVVATGHWLIAALPTGARAG